MLHFLISMIVNIINKKIINRSFYYKHISNTSFIQYFPIVKNVSERPLKMDPVCCLTHKWYHHSFIRIKLHRHHTLFLWFFCYCSIPFIDKLTLITTMKNICIAPPPPLSALDPTSKKMLDILNKV